ncbi:MAG: DUF423 domain-containing protein [Opitutia bacterium]|jgi:uncharacterized membrane protein YgdD (TMEM256/DUF423 family)
MRLRAAGALAAALAVGLGAFGAHGLKERLAALPAAAGWWETATLYLLVHAAAVAVLPASSSRLGRACLLLGALVFAGTLYAMALGAPRWLGAVTPLGGTALIVGWLCLGLAAAKDKSANP